MRLSTGTASAAHENSECPLSRMRSALGCCPLFFQEGPAKGAIRRFSSSESRVHGLRASVIELHNMLKGTRNKRIRSEAGPKFATARLTPGGRPLS